MEQRQALETFLARAAQLETQMQLEAHETQLRLDAMAHILTLADPHEQLAEFLALRLADEHQRSATSSHATMDITRELLECARQLPAGDGSDAALLATFFFACDAPPASASSCSHGVAPLLPVVAAMMERSAGLEEHPVLL